MANDARTFGAGTLLVIAGLLVLLVGVDQNHGQALNDTIVAGGVVILVGVGVLTGGVVTFDGGHDHG